MLATLDFPDAGAAFVQLQFMIENNFTKIDETSGKIALSSSDVLNGMTMLAGQMVQTVLANDIDATMQFSNRYCPHGLSLDRSPQPRLAILLYRQLLCSVPHLSLMRFGQRH
ncbi:hypothetical protein [Paraburkholderia sp. JHI869]|uniref:hypothetical protein n=1 Tax=Paraburkholderia sp. JHI869 TaxID=3112959 RepID=UPI00317281FC